MKQEITGYITGMINSYERTIDQYKKDEIPKEKYKKFDLVKEELSDLLDFVQDIPEEKLELVTISNSFDMEKIKSYARKLEGINADFRDENQKLTTQSKINERISIIREKDNADLRRDNIAWQKACNELKSKDELLKENLKMQIERGKFLEESFGIQVKKYESLRRRINEQ